GPNFRLGHSETPRSVQTAERPLLRRCPRAVEASYGAALQHEHFAQDPIRPAETILAGVFAATTSERGIDHVVFLHQLASTEIGGDNIVYPARGDGSSEVALAVVGQPLYGNPLQRRPAVRSVPLLTRFDRRGDESARFQQLRLHDRGDTIGI